MKKLIDEIKLSIESEDFAQRRTGRKGSSYYNGLAAGYRDGYRKGFAEAGRQSELFTCECSTEMERWNCTKDCINKPKIVRS